MGVFDGAAILALEAVEPSSPAAGRPGPVGGLDCGRVVACPTGERGVAVRPPGVPATLALTDDVDLAAATDAAGNARREGRVGLVMVLQPETAAGPHQGGRDCGVVSVRAAGEATVGEGWRVAEVACMPPVSIDDLVVCRPRQGERTHVGVAGAATTACGRLPLPRASVGHAGEVDCLRCLRSNVVASRLDAQLDGYHQLAAVAGRLSAAVAARLWLRVDHRGPERVPALLDAMVGAIVHQLPGAPDADATLARVRRHRHLASPPVRRWAQHHARRRLTDVLARVVPHHPTRLPPELKRELIVGRDLMEVAEAADVLVAALEAHGPASAVEPVALQAAVRAGQAASPRVARWREIHQAARALAGATAPRAAGAAGPTARVS